MFIFEHQLVTRRPSTDAEQSEYETVRLIFAAETEVRNQEISSQWARSLRTDWTHERRGTAP